MTTKEQITSVVAELNKCLPKAREVSCGYKVKMGRETYVTNRVSCITVIGRCHVENLEAVIKPAINKYERLGLAFMQHTSRHNIKFYFLD